MQHSKLEFYSTTLDASIDPFAILFDLTFSIVPDICTWKYMRRLLRSSSWNNMWNIEFVKWRRRSNIHGSRYEWFKYWLALPCYFLNIDILTIFFFFYFNLGTSAPEFFTNIMGTFVTKSDLGIGTIVGR